jgi:hypothetical protein
MHIGRFFRPILFVTLKYTHRFAGFKILRSGYTIQHWVKYLFSYYIRLYSNIKRFIFDFIQKYYVF